jgi:mycofactocin system transcriptional regulator
LFELQGFDETTMEQIADAVGVGRRTLFRYFPSKNDIPWGQFDESLRHFQEQFDAVPDDVPLAQAVHRCVIAFNDFDESAMPQHRTRMRLILTTPTLQAHSALRYEAWRAVISEYVGRRLALPADAAVPRLVGHVSLAVAVASYERWLADPELRLTDVLTESMAELTRYVSSA